MDDGGLVVSLCVGIGVRPDVDSQNCVRRCCISVAPLVVQVSVDEMSANKGDQVSILCSLPLCQYEK